MLGLLLVLVHLLGFVLLMVTRRRDHAVRCHAWRGRHGRRRARRCSRCARRSLEIGLAMLPGAGRRGELLPASWDGGRRRVRAGPAGSAAAAGSPWTTSTPSRASRSCSTRRSSCWSAASSAWAAVRRWRATAAGCRRRTGSSSPPWWCCCSTSSCRSPPRTCRSRSGCCRSCSRWSSSGSPRSTRAPGSGARSSRWSRVVCVTTAGYRLWQYDRLNGFLAEYVSAADWIEPNSTLLPIHFWHESDAPSGRRLTWRINPLYHAPGHIGVERNIINLRNLFLSPEVLGYFPMRYRPHRDPYVHIGEDDRRPAAGRRVPELRGAHRRHGRLRARHGDRAARRARRPGGGLGRGPAAARLRADLHLAGPGFARLYGARPTTASRCASSPARRRQIPVPIPEPAAQGRVSGHGRERTRIGGRHMSHERLRRFNARDTYPEQQLDNDLCQVVKARGTLVFVRARSGRTSRAARASRSAIRPARPSGR